MLDRKGLGDAGPGDLVVARRTRGRAKVERVLGPADRIENVLEALLVETGARQEFEPYTPPDITFEGRVDLRELTTLTIDPDTAKDFDDALSIDDDRAYVHIADVSYFIDAGVAARPRRGAARLLHLRPRPRRADAAARARRRPLQPSPARRPLMRHRRAAPRLC